MNHESDLALKYRESQVRRYLSVSEARGVNQPFSRVFRFPREGVAINTYFGGVIVQGSVDVITTAWHEKEVKLTPEQQLAQLQSEAIISGPPVGEIELMRQRIDAPLPAVSRTFGVITGDAETKMIAEREEALRAKLAVSPEIIVPELEAVVETSIEKEAKRSFTVVAAEMLRGWGEKAKGRFKKKDKKETPVTIREISPEDSVIARPRRRYVAPAVPVDPEEVARREVAIKETKATMERLDKIMPRVLVGLGALALVGFGSCVGYLQMKEWEYAKYKADYEAAKTADATAIAKYAPTITALNEIARQREMTGGAGNAPFATATPNVSESVSPARIITETKRIIKDVLPGVDIIEPRILTGKERDIYNLPPTQVAVESAPSKPVVISPIEIRQVVEGANPDSEAARVINRYLTPDNLRALSNLPVTEYPFPTEGPEDERLNKRHADLLKGADAEMVKAWKKTHGLSGEFDMRKLADLQLLDQISNDADVQKLQELFIAYQLVTFGTNFNYVKGFEVSDGKVTGIVVKTEDRYPGLDIEKIYSGNPNNILGR